MAQILLHGTLNVTIFEACDLKEPGMFRKLMANIEETVGIGNGSTRMYATVDLEKCRVGRTRMIENAPANPKWHETFHIYCAHMARHVVFTVKDNNPIGATLIGRAFIPVSKLLGGDELDEWLDICDDDKKPLHSGAKIHVKLVYFEVHRDRNWNQGIKSSKYPGVPHTFFPQRRGCKVSLYQDAHVPDKFIPKIPLDGGKKYETHRCWEDVFDAITKAKHLIYISGWSVYTEITLVRDSRRSKEGGEMKLGDLLLKKADEGVRVCMLVWDDRTSVSVLKKDGLMATHDEETEQFFNGSKVNCVLCPRDPDDGGSVIQDLKISTMFTHHQKIIVVDTKMPNPKSHNKKRRIMSFVGGLDLCDGRYDTPFHSLFRTLDTSHHDDFHQPNFPDGAIAKGGPREPWHDIHSRLEGPIAWDVLFNFEQRWRKQGGKDVLLSVREIDEIIPPSQVTFDDDVESWNVQLFRSIDGGAAFGFPDSPEEASNVGLVSGKNSTIDKSIQDAYVHAIRRAKNFIYIENQYFLGSTFAWDHQGEADHVLALHLIPKELSLKIVSKIEAGEKFRVYAVLPMWPEGIPESASVLAILNWQRRTMSMMYNDVYEALRARGSDEDPRSYLTFFCLANREVQKKGEYEPSESPEPDTDYAKAQQNRRFMIYVHSKMMIVDDEYIIVGSANINERSMNGARDTEIAIGAYQPYHLAKCDRPARGQVHGFRMALWYEHLGMLDDHFKHPENEECVEKVNRMADKYWDLYASDSLERDLPGHLVRYPMEVTRDGRVTMLGDLECFPDTTAQIGGNASDLLPPILTT